MIDELKIGLDQLDVSEFERFVKLLAEMYPNPQNQKNPMIVCCGAGRMGLQAAAFAMRLSHLGFNAFAVGDLGVPRIGEGDLLLVNSSSGETPSMLLLAEIATDAGANVALTSCIANSSIAELADHVFCMPEINSSQLMKTYYEQLSGLIFDITARELVERLGLDSDWVSKNHSILE